DAGRPYPGGPPPQSRFALALGAPNADGRPPRALPECRRRRASGPPGRPALRPCLRRANLQERSRGRPVTDEIELAMTVGAVLERLGIPYFLGGSMASAYYGETRSTNDIDIVAGLTEPQIEPLASALGSDFVIDTDALRNAVRTQSSWN